MLFDNSKRRTDALVISSLDGFMEGMLSVRDWSHSSSSQSGADDTCDTCTSEVDVDYYGNDLYQVDNVTSAEVSHLLSENARIQRSTGRRRHPPLTGVVARKISPLHPSAPRSSIPYSLLPYLSNTGVLPTLSARARLPLLLLARAGPGPLHEPVLPEDERCRPYAA